MNSKHMIIPHNLKVQFKDSFPLELLATEPTNWLGKPKKPIAQCTTQGLYNDYANQEQTAWGYNFTKKEDITGFLRNSGITIREQTPRDYAMLDAIVSLIKRGNMAHARQAHITNFTDGASMLVFEGTKPFRQHAANLTAKLYK